jgi:hypothetical protein
MGQFDTDYTISKNVENSENILFQKDFSEGK